ncbi:MAG: hypothetical protein ACODAB_10145 [Gemmatimonadota bacterium]
MTDTDPRGPYGRRPLPARSDWRRALGVYVAGRSRALTLDEKRGLAGGSRGGDDGESALPGATRPSPVAYGVRVPPVLDFYRNASTWRDRLPEPKSRGETTADA